MRVLVLILSVISCTWAKLPVPVGAPIDLGSFDVDVSIGSFKPRYPVLTRADLIASSSARQWIYSITPSYDPFRLDKVDPTKIDNVFAKGTLKASNIRLRGLKGLRVDELELRMYYNEPNESPYRVDLNVTLPRAQLDVDIDAQLLIFLAYTDIIGHIKVRVEGLTLWGTSSASPVVVRGQTVFQHHGLKATAHVDNIQLRLDLKGVSQDILENQELILQAANSMKDVVSNTVAATLLETLNEILAQYPRAQVEEYLLNPQSLFK